MKNITTANKNTALYAAAKNPLAKEFSLCSLLRFAAPSIGMMIIIALYTTTDGIFIGRFAGDAALAASNIVYPAFNLLLGLSIMLSTGGSALVAKTLGEKRPAEAAQYFSCIMAAGIGLSLLLMTGGLLFIRPLLFCLGAPDALFSYSYDYLHGLLIFTPFILAKILFDAFFIVDGRPVFGFFLSLFSGLCNAGLDWLFLAVWEWGVGGAAIATGIANAIAALAGLWYFTFRSRTLRLRRFHWQLRILQRTCSNGISEMVTEFSLGFTTYLFNIITFAWAGESGVAAISVILYTEMLLTSALLGFVNGIAPVFSFHYGAGHHALLCRLLRRGLFWISLASVLALATAWLLAAPLIHLFLPQDNAVFLLTLHGFKLFSLSFLICGFNIFTIGFFTAISQGRTSAICSFARNLAGISIFLLVLPHFLGLNGVWLAVPAADLCALLLSLFLLREQHRSFAMESSATPHTKTAIRPALKSGTADS